MSLNAVTRSLAWSLTAHRRARALFDTRIDAMRGGPALDPEDASAFDAHLASCTDCRGEFDLRVRAVEALRALGTAKAPEGFAGRVLLAARARGKTAPAVEERPSWWMGHAPLVTGGALVALVVIGLGTVVAVGPFNVESGESKKIEAMGQAQTIAPKNDPHFVVRAPGIGAAKARAQVMTVIRDHQGTVADAGEHAIIARLPRAALIGVAQDLARAGRYKMNKVVDGELEAGLDQIIIRFELE